MPDISFIIPVYNVSAYLMRFFEPFKACDLSCEIIFINDGSTDSSAEILSQLSREDSRVIIFNKQNGGVSSARNYGITHASGEFISCLDPDDIISPTFFHYIALARRKYPEADTFVYSYHKFYDGTIPEIQEMDVSGVVFELVPKSVLSSLHNYPWLRVTRREFYIDNLFPEGIIYEDSVTVPLLNAQANKVVRTNASLYYYRVRKDSLTNFDIKRNMDLIRALDILESKVVKHPEYKLNFYTCVAHLSRSALIVLFKLSGQERFSILFKESYSSIITKFNQYPLLGVLKTDAKTSDKICFVLLKSKRVGFFFFKLLYRLINR